MQQQQQQQQQAGGMHTACGEQGMRRQQSSYAHCELCGKQQADGAHFELRSTQAHVP
jgi:hypothetical protein